MHLEITQAEREVLIESLGYACLRLPHVIRNERTTEEKRDRAVRRLLTLDAIIKRLEAL